MKKIIVIVLPILLATGCSHFGKEEHIDKSQQKNNINPSTTRNLDFDFKISGIDTDLFNQYGVFTKLRITRNQKTIFEYDNGDEIDLTKLQTIILPINKKNNYLIFIETVSKPSKSRMKCIQVADDKVSDEIDLPFVEFLPKNLDNDKNKEFIGYWEHFELYGDGYTLTTHNPLIAYEITEEKVKVDTSLTVQYNTEIYSRFWGFDFSDQIPQDSSCIRKLEEMIVKLKN